MYWDGSRWVADSVTAQPTPAGPRTVRRKPYLAIAIGVLLLVPAFALGRSRVLDDTSLVSGGPSVTVKGVAGLDLQSWLPLPS